MQPFNLRFDSSLSTSSLKLRVLSYPPTHRQDEHGHVANNHGPSRSIRTNQSTGNGHGHGHGWWLQDFCKSSLRDNPYRTPSPRKTNNPKMLWNWDTIDTCFISSTWHITSAGMFAGSCIGVILLVMSLEFLRRAVKEFDRFLIRQHGLSSATKPSTSSNTDRDTSPKRLVNVSTEGLEESTGFRPSIAQQAVRAGLHTVQFAVAYFVML